MAYCAIYCSVPTVYQLNSISKLMNGADIKKVGDGSFIARLTFDKVSHAKEWLKGRAEELYDYNKVAIRENLNLKRGVLHWDATGCYIIKKSEDEE